MRAIAGIFLCGGLILAFQNCGSPMAQGKKTVQSLAFKADLEQSEQIIKAQIQKSCEQDSDCRAVGFGSRACGGPREALVYSISSPNFDEAAFLEDITAFNQSEREYNISNRVVSICILEAVPEQLSCVQNICQVDTL